MGCYFGNRKLKIRSWEQGRQERMNDMAEMNPKTPKKPTGKLKLMLSGKKSRKWIVLCVLAVAVIGGAAAFMSRTKAKGRQGGDLYTTAAVEKRSITNSLTGSGTLSASRFLHRYYVGVRRDSQRYL